MIYHKELRGKLDRFKRPVMRTFAMDLSDEILLSPILQGDLTKTLARGECLRDILRGDTDMDVCRIRLHTPSGTDLAVRVDPEKLLLDAAPAFLAEGFQGSLPIGQLFALIKHGQEHSIQGMVVVDVSYTGGRRLLGRESHRLSFLVYKGRIVWETVECGSETVRNQFLKILRVDENVSRLCGVGFGLVPGLELKGKTDWDEKALGVVSVEFGNNVMFGGIIDSSIHLVCTMLNPEVTVTEADGSFRSYQAGSQGLEPIMEE